MAVENDPNETEKAVLETLFTEPLATSVMFKNYFN